ncbi:unknown protein [Seminavis robusta]|uniref:Uncharacterized protein n=1 Tax=Seminavis robusta TaxID=568900 RepID=A0A9N8EAK2_9STRA|nr:unknown protein [Seminavis robusta]|eukprot:Sro887_g216340.1 n/a (432) ;mRNA; r:33883-35178
MACEQCRDPPGERPPCSFIEAEEGASVASSHFVKPPTIIDKAPPKHSEDEEGKLNPKLHPPNRSETGSATGSSTSVNAAEESQERVASREEEPKKDHPSHHSLTEVPSEDQLDLKEVETAVETEERSQHQENNEPKKDTSSHMDSLSDTSTPSVASNSNINQLNPKLRPRKPTKAEPACTTSVNREASKRGIHPSSSALTANGASKIRLTHRRSSLQSTAMPARKPTKGLRRFFAGRKGSLDFSTHVRRGLRRSEVDMALKRTSMFGMRPSILQTVQQELDSFSESAASEEEEEEVEGGMELLPGAVAVGSDNNNGRPTIRESTRMQTNSNHIPVAFMVDDDCHNEIHQQEVKALRRLVAQKDSRIEALERELAVLRQRLNMEMVIAEPLPPVFGGGPLPKTTSTQDRQADTLTKAEKFALNILLNDKRGK